MESKKQPRRVTASGEVSVKRSLANRKTGALSVDGGAGALDPPEQIEGPVAEVSGTVGMTIPQDAEFEMLRIDVGGRLPCSVADLMSGAAVRRLHDILRREFLAQKNRGTRGLQ